MASIIPGIEHTRLQFTKGNGLILHTRESHDGLPDVFPINVSIRTSVSFTNEQSCFAFDLCNVILMRALKLITHL